MVYFKVDFWIDLQLKIDQNNFRIGYKMNIRRSHSIFNNSKNKHSLIVHKEISEKSFIVYMKTLKLYKKILFQKIINFKCYFMN